MDAPFSPGSSSTALMFFIFTDLPLSVAKTSLCRKKLQPSYVKSAAMLKNARGWPFHSSYITYSFTLDFAAGPVTYVFVQNGGRWFGRVSDNDIPNQRILRSFPQWFTCRQLHTEFTFFRILYVDQKSFLVAVVDNSGNEAIVVQFTFQQQKSRWRTFSIFF